MTDDSQKDLSGSSPEIDFDRGELTDEDLDALDQAIANIDFATRKASPERLTRLDAQIVRLTDLANQIRQEVRTQGPERPPLTAEEEKRYEQLVEQGIAAGERGNLEEAMRTLQQAVEVHPEGLSGLFNLGVVYGLMAHMNIAKAEFYDSYVRDEVFMEKAKICYDRVLDQEPDHLPSLNNLATLYALRDERDVAIEVLERMIQVQPKDANEQKFVEEAKRQLDELKRA